MQMQLHRMAMAVFLPSLTILSPGLDFDCFFRTKSCCLLYPLAFYTHFLFSLSLSYQLSFEPRHDERKRKSQEKKIPSKVNKRRYSDDLCVSMPLALYRARVPPRSLGSLRSSPPYSLCSPCRAAVHGVDVSKATPSAAWSCLKSSGYSFAIIRAYRSIGEPDINSPKSINDAWAAGEAFHAKGV